MKQCYPNTAIVGLQVDAEQFGGQQMTVNYHIRGRIIQVPSNYDPEKRTYSGIWDGSLKPAYSNNPAWCLWDMLTPPALGHGEENVWGRRMWTKWGCMHRAVLRPDGPGWFPGDRAADDA